MTTSGPDALPDRRPRDAAAPRSGGSGTPSRQAHPAGVPRGGEAAERPGDAVPQSGDRAVWYGQAAAGKSQPILRVMSLGSAWDTAGGDGGRRESELQSFASLIRRRKYIVAAVIIVAVVGAATLVSITPPVYQGRALIRTESSPARAGTAADQREASIGLASTQAKIMSD